MLLATHAQWPDTARGMLADALSRPAPQQPGWADGEAARAVCGYLAAVPPVVSLAEVEHLGTLLAAVANGAAFVVQGGDCAETFADTHSAHVSGNLATLGAVARVISRGAGLPVVRVARMAGQFAKPRSSPLDADGLPAYRGDMVNSQVPTAAARRPDPARMASAYRHAVIARDLMRRFDPGVFASHEALILDYESPLVRPAPRAGLFSGAGHFLWIGERTRQLDGAHIAFAGLLRNPVGVKIGPGTSPELAAEYAERLDPLGCPGRLTLIARMGRDLVREVLPPIVERVTASGRKVVWQCDPMHANTRVTAAGRKMRDLDDVIEEVRGFIEVHRHLGTHPGGLHLELTGDDVTECVDRAGTREADVAARYRTACDPRLNDAQARELAAVVGPLLGGRAIAPS